MSRAKYHITYEFDARNEPPKVTITGGEQVRVAVDEAPLCQLGGFLMEGGAYLGVARAVVVGG